jgi:hypothetical protein
MATGRTIRSLRLLSIASAPSAQYRVRPSHRGSKYPSRQDAVQRTLTLIDEFFPVAELARRAATGALR